MTKSYKNKNKSNEDINIDVKRLSPAQRKSYAWLNEDERLEAIVGFGNSLSLSVKPVYIESGTETSLESDSLNAGIVIQKDRPNSIFSGYGGKGHQKCATIDLVAGRASALNISGVKNEEGGESPAYVDPSFQYDAARIYISEKTDIDDNFNLRRQSRYNFVPKSVGRSAIGLKGDSIRIIGNEGIRLVTGVYPENSRDGTNTLAGIELVSGNSNEEPFDLQPFVKGHNLVSSLNDLWGEIYNISSILMSFIEQQKDINELFSEHTHIVGNIASFPPAIPAGGSPSGGNLAVPSREEFKAEFDVRNGEFIEEDYEKLDQILENLLRWEKVWISPEGWNYLLSRYNGTN